MYAVLYRPLLYKRFNLLPLVQMITTQRNVALHSGCGHEEKKKGGSRLKIYWFHRLANYLSNYEKTLQKNFPKTMHFYHILSVGTKHFYRDLKKYITVLKKRKLQGIDSLSRMELELLYTMPKDFLQVSPCLLISILPFVGGLVFLLAYLFPRRLLTRHYWTVQQRLEFLLLEHKARLKHNKSLFRCIQAEVPHINDPTLKQRWSGIIACLDNGTHPTAGSIISCSKLFIDHPYSLSALKQKHMKELLAIHNMSVWRPFKKQRLMERGTLIAQMDRAIQREGGVEEMSIESLRWALSFRGVSPSDESTEKMKEWLNAWLAVSDTVNENMMSLLLHCPILLAYNYPANRILIYK